MHDCFYMQRKGTHFQIPGQPKPGNNSNFEVEQIQRHQRKDIKLKAYKGGNYKHTFINKFIWTLHYSKHCSYHTLKIDKITHLKHFFLHIILFG